MDGQRIGAETIRELVWSGDRELYAGAFKPYVKRTDAMRYGGVAAVVGGAILLVLSRGR